MARSKKYDGPDFIRLKPQSLRRELAKLDQFIAAVPAELIVFRKALEDANNDYTSIDRQWKDLIINFHCFQEIDKILDALGQELFRRKEKRRSLLSKFFKSERPPEPGQFFCQLKISYVSVLYGLPGIAKYDSLLAAFVKELCEGSNPPLFHLSEASQVAQRLRSIFVKGRDSTLSAIRSVVTQVEDSQALRGGSFVRNWAEWKQTMAKWAEGERAESYPMFLPGPYIPWRFQGRRLDAKGTEEKEGILQDAHDERKLILEALEFQKQEALEIKRKHGYTDETIAAAAAYLGRTVDLAAELRVEMLSELGDQVSCPYCNGSLGDIPHLDHIHPSSQGGLSKRDNLVFVCATCNAYKRDLTLLSFAEDRAFDFMTIAVRLRAMGKRV